MVDDAHTLAREYTETSLYRALRDEVQALVTEANARDTSDPYEITKLRGTVEFGTRILSTGFLISVAQRAILSRELVETPKAPAAAGMHPHDWWADPADLVN